MRRLLLPLLLLLAADASPAGQPRVYVTPAEVTAWLPRALPPGAPPLPLVQARALPLLTGPAAGSAADVRFRAASPLPPWLRLDEFSGQLSLVATPHFSPTGERDVEVEVEVLAVHQSGGERAPSQQGVDSMRLRLRRAGLGACERPPLERCLWPGAVLRVLENLPAGTPLGPLGPPQPRPPCPGEPAAHPCKAVAANISESSDAVRVELSDGVLQAWSTRPLDRERQHWLQLAPEAARHQLDVEVLDADDSVPSVVNGGHSSQSPAGLLRKGEPLNAVLFEDADSPAVNHYSWRFVNDSLRLLAANCSKEALSRANTTPNSNMTVLRCNVSAARDAVLPRAGYSTLLRITDLGLQAQGGPASKHVRPHADAEVRLSVSGPQPAAQQGAAPDVSYPREAALLSGATPYSRVAQPDRLPALLNASWLTFKLASVAPRLHPFAVTPVAGIVYLKSPKQLDPNVTLYNVTVVWGSAGSASIAVRVLEGASAACSGDPRPRPSCATRDSPAKCNELCGQGTGARNFTLNHLHEGRNATPRAELVPQGGCAWRASRAVSPSQLTVHYATCTPDVRHCPDGICDPLEKLSRSLCPQDCANASFGAGMGGAKLGLYSCAGGAVGVCSRDNKCTCSTNWQGGAARAAPPTTSTTTTSSSTTTTTTAPSSESPVALGSAAGGRASCGAVCVLAVVAGSGLLLSAAGALLYWRYRRCGRLQRERKLAVVGGTTASDYVQRAAPPDARLLTHEARPPVDPQWEFPRSRLLVEKTLGEGEFGRVLRARAIDIAGVPGATTVAVKTLKEGAGASEQRDLLSEYELLKAVSHPHVVRLLGACTAPGGPLYLIIEFAEHGSLRNYLRRSRHIEPSVLPVTPTTPHKILSFAWQICKGMAYLSDMKLVHRDLAARNILVAAGGICKVSDFGLTRDVYEDDTYLKKSKGRVPVKWMALESLMDHVYTSKSDVWSFGVVLWELVTLGASPYPGVAVHNLYHLLQAGYRMECPENCSAALYKVMRQCWQEEASERPSFKQLTAIFERMLKDSAEYLDLNPSIVQNPGYFGSRSNSQEKLSCGDVSDDDNDIGYGNLNILPTDSVNYLMSTARSGLSQRQQLWHVTEDNQKPLTSNSDKEECFSLVPAEQNSYLSPIQVHSGKGQVLAYVNMTNGVCTEQLQSGTTNNIMFCSTSNSCPGSCSSKVTPL